MLLDRRSPICKNLKLPQALFGARPDFVAYAIAADFPGLGVWYSVFGGSVFEVRVLDCESLLIWEAAVWGLW